MNKEWFIFKGTHHLGPFSVKEMEDFFATGEVTAQSLIWREGAEKWEALSKTAEFLFLINKTVKPELPQLPVMEDDVPPPMPPVFLNHAVPQDIEDDSDEPPPIPLDAFLDPRGVGRTYKKKKKSKVSANSPRLILAGLAVVFAVVLMWFYMNEQSSAIQLRVKGLMPVYLDKLQEIAAQKIPSIAVGTALSLDGRTIFASTNKDGEILSIIKLTSIPKRTLGTEEVELMVRGVMKDHLGVFSRMQLTKGSQFVPGEYNMQFTGRKMHFLNRNLKFLNNIEFFKKLNTNYTYESQTLIYAGTPREFEKKLMTYSESIVNEKLKPFTDKLERLQTFQSLLNKTVEDYLLALESIKKPSEISGYEAKYIKEVSPIVQSLVVAASEMSKKEEEEVDTSNKIAPYSGQVLIGKDLGELASDMITETQRSNKKLTSSDKTSLKNRFEGRYKALKNKIDTQIAELQARIQKISN